MQQRSGKLEPRRVRRLRHARPIQGNMPCQQHRTTLPTFSRALGIARDHRHPPAALHRRGKPGAPRRDPGRPHQEPVPQGQEGRALPRRRPRGCGNRPEAAASADRRLRPPFLRQAGAPRRDARRDRRARSRPSASSTTARPGHRSSSRQRSSRTTPSTATRSSTPPPRPLPSCDLLAFIRATGHEPRILPLDGGSAAEL